MNFTSETEDPEIQVELKYCERCGGLWLRRQGTGGVYCASCHVLLAARPDPGEPPPRKSRRRREAHPQKQETDNQEENRQSSARINYLQGVAVAEVCA
jgi:uncharacterized Zn finger protein (UPF0148 family)